MISIDMATSAGAWQQVTLSLGDQDQYPYWYGYDCMDRIADELRSMGADRFLILTDDHVLAVHGEAFLSRLGASTPVNVLSSPPGEGMKSLAVLGRYLESALAFGATRSTVVVTFGGGVVGNLGGLVAALLFRGIRLVHVPTTIIAAMDSVISLKQAINSSRGKNHFGVYHRPSAVLIDLQLLQTLPPHEVRSGLCEAIKNCLAIRPEMIGEFRRRVIDGDPLAPEALGWLLLESVAAKSVVMVDDARERHAGIVLEYGHTVGHAVELCDQRIRGTAALTHGEAVGIGMVAAARISRERGWLTDWEVALHESLLEDVGAPTRIPEWLEVEELLQLVRHDNKRGYLTAEANEAPLVLLSQLGRPVGESERPLVLVRFAEIEKVVSGMRSPATRTSFPVGIAD